MNYFDLYSSYPDPTIAAAWDSQVKEVDKTSWLAEKLATRESELFARFAACYAELRALPRSARRALQRRIARSSELAAIFPGTLTAWRTTAPASDGLVVGRCRSIARAGSRSGDGGHDHCHDKQSQHHSRWAMFADRSHRQRQQRCSDSRRLRGGERSGYDCAAGKRQRDTQRCRQFQLRLHRVCRLITSRITIEGNGATIARQASAPDFGLIAVRGNSGDLTLQSVTLSGGSFGGV